MSNIDQIINEYQELSKVFSSLEQVTNGLISTLISNNNIQVHSITGRTKTESSLLGKISRPEKNYKTITELTDIVGIRITTYFSDHVDLISQIISSEFLIDDENSIDKRKAIDPDRFGYMSLHLVAEHSTTRTQLPEYDKFKNIKFEIQIRTILQHAWAEIEHDIGYKSKAQVPHLLRRRFSRLSGLLELADEEFFGIRNEIQGYKNELNTTISESPSKVYLDLDSIESLINSDETILQLELEMSKVFKCQLSETNRARLSSLLSYINILNITTVEELKKSYTQVQPYIHKFLEYWLEYPNGEERTFTRVNKGISLLYLAYITLGLRDDDYLYEKFFSATRFSSKEEMPARIKATLDSVKT